MLSAFNGTQKRKAEGASFFTIFKKLKRNMSPIQIEKTSISLSSLPDEIALQVIDHFLPKETLMLRQLDKRLNALVSYDYYQKLLNSPQVQEDIQRPILCTQDLEALFEEQQLEINILTTNSSYILANLKPDVGQSIHLLTFNTAIPSMCDTYAHKAIAGLCKGIFAFSPLIAFHHFLQNMNYFPNVSVALISERALSFAFWTLQAREIENRLTRDLDKLRTIPQGKTPFDIFARHTLLNSINQWIMRAKICSDMLHIVPQGQLGFYGRALTRIPAAILKDKVLESYWEEGRALLLGRNFITKLPNSLAKLNQLRMIDLHENCLSHFPNVLLKLPLTDLRLIRNYLQELPAELPDILLGEAHEHRISKEATLAKQEEIPTPQIVHEESPELRSSQRPK